MQAAWKSPSAVEPSPSQVAAIRLSPLIAEAIAQPAACGVLRREIAADGEEAVLLGGIHDRKLTALQPVPPVRVDLVDHLDQRIAARDQAATAGGRRGRSCRPRRVPSSRRCWSPPPRCISCRSWSCPGAARDTSARRRRGSARNGAAWCVASRGRGAGSRGRVRGDRPPARGPCRSRADACRRPRSSRRAGVARRLRAPRRR